PHFSMYASSPPPDSHSYPTRRSSDLLLLPAARLEGACEGLLHAVQVAQVDIVLPIGDLDPGVPERLGDGQPELRLNGESAHDVRSEEHTSELQSRENLVCRLLLEKKK